ncbi:MAG: RsmB/NOP family class I SAM-dependent RNA methyltransferase [Bacteroidetes bacterium]|nr:RsmB/NOP family class I SAM-dependent RNA methyltransferase [Bacteroidota bacterium]
METVLKFSSHKNITAGVIRCLQDIFGQDVYADQAIRKLLKENLKWGARDRKHVAGTIYDIVRWWRLLWESAGREPSLNVPDLDFLLHYYYSNELSALRQKQTYRTLRESIPDWLDKLGSAELGNSWDTEISAQNSEAPVMLRTNTLKISAAELIQKLSEEGVASDLFHHPGNELQDIKFPETIVLRERKNVFLTRIFKEGLFEVQDGSSQAVSHFLDVKPGMRAVDACAGAGGKALHLAALMKNKGRIIALDISETKLTELKKRAARAGADIIETRLIRSKKIIKRLTGSADRLLLDVPCSGLGIMRRNPDAKWKLTPEAIERVKREQENILGNYSLMLKPGGRMVYSTCSILPSENEEPVKKFLSVHPGFRFIREQKFSPAINGLDGFYMALMERLM